MYANFTVCFLTQNTQILLNGIKIKYNYYCSVMYTVQYILIYYETALGLAVFELST